MQMVSDLLISSPPQKLRLIYQNITDEDYLIYPHWRMRVILVLRWLEASKCGLLQQEDSSFLPPSLLGHYRAVALFSKSFHFRHPAAAAAAKSLQSCLTLCDPIDGSPPGSPVPGILQARTRSGLPFPSPMHESEKRKWSGSVVSDS